MYGMLVFAQIESIIHFSFGSVLTTLFITFKIVVLLFLMSCLSAILVSTPFLNLQKMRAFSWFFKMGFLRFLAIKSFLNVRLLPLMNKNQNGEEEEDEKKVEGAEDIISLLDLQGLPLECILERLSPSGLCSIAGVCTSLREKSISDHLWEKHMKQKWSKLICSNAASYQQWQKHKASRKRVIKQSETQWQTGFLSSFWFGIWNVEKENDKKVEKMSCLPEDSVMSWYLAIETGKFWFPAQVLNRENSHVGFMLSCYDAEVSYECNTDTFVARFLANGRRTIEDNIGWNRIRVATTSTPADVLHISDCLNDLRPGDHIEIQWRKSKEFPYGWWYGVVGHLESCNGIESLCQCSTSDIVVLEFKQYAMQSRWRKTLINRKEHGEVGNEGDGFYGGIRKLSNEMEISMWKSLCLICTL